MQRLDLIAKTLADHQVDFVLLGNYGAQIQGAQVLTEDADMAYHRGQENLVRMMAALEEMGARIRFGDETAGLPYSDPLLLASGDIWNLPTVHGDLDLLYAPAGGGYDDLIQDAVEVEIGDGVMVLAASLDDIIRSKQLANREKDHIALPELRRFRDEQRRQRDGPGLSCAVFRYGFTARGLRGCAGREIPIAALQHFEPGLFHKMPGQHHEHWQPPKRTFPQVSTYPPRPLRAHLSIECTFGDRHHRRLDATDWPAVLLGEGLP